MPVNNVKAFRLSDELTTQNHSETQLRADNTTTGNSKNRECRQASYITGFFTITKPKYRSKSISKKFTVLKSNLRLPSNVSINNKLPPNNRGTKINPLKVVIIQPIRYHRDGSIDPKNNAPCGHGFSNTKPNTCFKPSKPVNHKYG